MTAPERLDPPYRDERGWRTEPQAKVLWKPLPLWKRYTLADWLFVAVCVAGAVACIWVVFQ